MQHRMRDYPLSPEEIQKFLAEKGLPEARIKGTAVVKITIEHITGKYYRR